MRPTDYQEISSLKGAFLLHARWSSSLAWPSWIKRSGHRFSNHALSSQDGGADGCWGALCEFTFPLICIWHRWFPGCLPSISLLSSRTDQNLVQAGLKAQAFRLGNVLINKNVAVAAPLLMKEKWSMSSSAITESLNIFISRFRCWGSWSQITEQPLMSLCPYLLSLLTACYLQLYNPLGGKEWILQHGKGWEKIQKLIKSVGKRGSRDAARCMLAKNIVGLGGKIWRCLVWKSVNCLHIPWASVLLGGCLLFKEPVC